MARLFSTLSRGQGSGHTSSVSSHSEMSLLTQYHDYQNKELAQAEIVCTGVSVCVSFFVHRCALPFFDFLTKDDSYSKRFPLLFYCPFPGEFDYNYL